MLMYHEVARLDIFKRFPRFLWRPGDTCYPSYTVLKNISTLLMFINRVMYRDVLFMKTVMPQVFECCVFTIVMLNMSCTCVDKQEEPDIKNTQISEYDEFTMKLTEKVNKEAMMTKLKMTKGCENCSCYPHCMMNEQGKTVGILAEYVELYKESLFPNLLDRTLDKFEDYKAELLDKDEDVKEDLHASVNAHTPI